MSLSKSQPLHHTQANALPDNWRTWLQENVARGCTPESLLTLLQRDGGFAPEIARAALAQVMGEFKVVLPNRPDIDTRGNSVDIEGHLVDIRVTLQHPRVVVLDKVLTLAECDALVALAEPRLQRSSVVEQDNGVATLHSHRTSAGTMFQRAETELTQRIEQRLARLCNWPLDHAEGLQVLCYGPGEEYRPHFDWFDPGKPGPRKHMEHGGQRVGTVVLYLSDVAAGGGTSFPSLGLEVNPRKGSAVFFADIDAHGHPDELTLHAGMPVIKGTKYIATKWMRERFY